MTSKRIMIPETGKIKAIISLAVEEKKLSFPLNHMFRLLISFSSRGLSSPQAVNCWRHPSFLPAPYSFLPFRDHLR